MALLESVLSKPRLDGYRLSAIEIPRVVIGRYRWNLALSKALHQELHLLEVAFRNRLHEGLKFHFGAAAWFDLPWLSLREQGAVSRVNKRLQEDGAPLEPDRVVAELDFGFWTSLLNSSYDQIIWNQRGLLHRAFRSMLHWLAPRVLSLLIVPHLFEDVHAQGPELYESEVDG